MLAYHNDPAVKAKYISRVQAHRAADELIQGTGWRNGKGCAVGCTLESYEHARYPVELGIPLQLAHLEDALFELLDVRGAMAWPERFLSAIRPGADLSGVWAQWAIWSLTDPEHGVIRHAKSFPDVESAILRVSELWRNGGTHEQLAWAAWAVAEAARAARAAWAAEAARAARAAGAAEAAWLTWTNAACDKLIALLEAAP